MLRLYIRQMYIISHHINRRGGDVSNFEGKWSQPRTIQYNTIQ